MDDRESFRKEIAWALQESSFLTCDELFHKVRELRLSLEAEHAKAARLRQALAHQRQKAEWWKLRAIEAEEELYGPFVPSEEDLATVRKKI